MKKGRHIGWLTQKKPISLFFIIIVLVGGGILGGGAAYLINQSKTPTINEGQNKENIYLAFTGEIYTLIQENYWQKISDDDLTNLYFLAIEKLTSQQQTAKVKDLDSLLTSIDNILSQIEDEDTKGDFIAQLNNLVISNLEPFGRSQLYGQQEEENLDKTVRNVSDQDYYQILGLEQNSSSEEINQAYQDLTQEAQEDNDEEKLAQINQAYGILADEETKQTYDASGVIPTISYQEFSPDILYLHLEKVSPTSFEELQRISEKNSTNPDLTTLILDLRDNIGGAIDNLPYLLGPFIGQDQYAYQFFHQEVTSDYKTRTDWLPGLVQYKKVVILINENTQSSAEVMASVLKKYSVGVLVGNTTRGWGTVERVFSLENQISQSQTYSVLLAHSLTLREDGQAIEGLGVDPNIFITSDDWPEQLYSYIPDQNLVQVVQSLINQESSIANLD